MSRMTGHHRVCVSLGLATLNMINRLTSPFSIQVLGLTKILLVARTFILFTHVSSLALIGFPAALGFLFNSFFLALEHTMPVEILVVFIDSIERLVINMSVHLRLTLRISNWYFFLNYVEASLQIIYIFITILDLLDEHFEVFCT